MAWPGVAKAEMGQGSILVKNDEKVKVLRMSLPIVESLSGLPESVLSLFRGPQLKNLKNCQILLFYPPSPY